MYLHENTDLVITYKCMYINKNVIIETLTMIKI